MFDSFYIRFRAMRWRAHGWLARHPRLREGLHAAGSMHSHPEAIARGAAIGLFIGLTPTVGFQTVLMLACCVMLSGNFPTAFVASFVSNPFTTAPLYWGFHQLGKGLLDIVPLLPDEPDAWYLQGVGDEIVFTLAGSLSVATPVAAIGYVLVKRISVALFERRRKRFRKRG